MTHFYRFAERHRLLINVYLRQNPRLLDGSFGALLKCPRLVDFDAKNEYFRGQMKALHGDRRIHPLRLKLRRDFLFEDSFRQLQAKSVLFFLHTSLRPVAAQSLDHPEALHFS